MHSPGRKHGFKNQRLLQPRIEQHPSYKENTLAELRKPLVNPSQPARQVIFVHGLNGDKLTTWSPSSDAGAFWPDWLTTDVPGTAVWSLGYPASASNWERDGSAMALPDRAANILPLLMSEIGPTTGDIVFVGYSLGGLVVQSLLRRAEGLAPHDVQIAMFMRRVRGFVLLGTPTGGSVHANVLNLCSWLFRPRETIRDLTRENPHVRDLNTWFRGFVPKNRIKALVIREHKAVRIWGTIVTPSSADPGLPVSTPVIPVDEDHVSLSHPASRDSEVYRLIADFVRSPFDEPHPDTLVADGLTDVADMVRYLKEGVKSQTNTLHNGQINIERELQRISPQEHPTVTRDALGRLSRFKKIRFSAGFDLKREIELLFKAAENGDLTSASNTARQSIFAWTARVLASIDYSAAQVACEKAAQLGESDETTIARAFVLAFAPAQKKASALALLEDLNTPAARTAKLIVSAQNEAPELTLKWFQDTRLELNQLDADGKYWIIRLQLSSMAWSEAFETVQSLVDGDYEECPCLHICAATVSLGLAINEDIRQIVLTNAPHQLEDIHLGEDASSMRFRTIAISHFKKASTAFETLNLTLAATAASDGALWLSLRDPALNVEAIASLEASLRDAKTRLRRLPMALAIGLKLDMQAVEREIDAETAITGGKSANAAIARLAIAVRRKAPEIAEYIDKHRSQLQEYYSPNFLDALTIEALAKAGLIDESRAKLAALESKGAEAQLITNLRMIINEATGSDPVGPRIADYTIQPTLQKLIVLVDHLKAGKDFPSLADYAGRLFESVKDVATAEVYSSALYETYQDEKITEIEARYPEIVRASDNLGTNVSWAYYRLGRLKESKVILDELRAKRDTKNDRLLSFNIAIASGDWSLLNALVESEWMHRDQREAAELLRAGIVAQRTGSSPRSQELIRAAAEKGKDDPNILVSCYTAASSAGWENEEAIHDWLATAINKSGTDGPVKRFDLEELLELNPGWNEHMDRTSDLLLQGEAPMFLAAQAANRTLLDIFLRPALRNPVVTDVRKRQIIFGFSGNKPNQKCPGRRIAIDVTALLTLTITDQLSSALKWCERVTISHTTLGWLFQERDSLAFHQPSQVRRSEEIRALLDKGQLYKFEGAAPPPEIEQEVGNDIAKYLVAAKALDAADTIQKVVVRPSPLPKAGTLLKEEANVSGFENYLVGCQDVIRTLRTVGQLTGSEESRAVEYLKLRENPWPNSPTVQSGATLYLDDLAVSYFQHLGVLERLSAAGFKVFITESEIERASDLVGFDDTGDRAKEVIETLRATLREGIESGKVVLGRLHAKAEGSKEFESHPTNLILLDTTDSDALVIDDRSINRLVTMDKTPIINTLDLLSSLADAGVIGLEALGDAWTRLRQAGFIFIPHRSSEILTLLSAAPVIKGKLMETAELKAIRQSIVRSRMTDALQLPEEALWIDSMNRELVSSLRAQWTDEIPDVDARARSSWALDLLDVRGWSHRSGSAEIEMADRYRAQIMMLLMHTSSKDAAKKRYWRWLEGAALAELKAEQPDSYKKLIDEVERVIDKAVKREFPGGHIE